MRFALTATLIFALAAVAAPPASAQGAAFLDDATGDTELQVFGGPGVPLSNAEFDAADLTSLVVDEGFESFTFVIGVKTVTTAASSSRYAISFVWKDLQYEVFAGRQVIPGAGASEWGYVTSYSEENGYNYLADLQPTFDATANTVSLTLPKVYVLDSNNRMPGLGDKLEDVFVTSQSDATFLQFSTGAADRMPDTDEKPYPIAVGDVSSGTLRMSSEERVRVSNGDSTTFVYRAVLENRAETQDSVDVTLADLPAGWNATIQSPVKVPGKSQRTITALVSVPFEHVHGGFSGFNLTATSQRDPASRAVVRMGILHTPIAQPAGHHAELYLHASNQNSGLFGDQLPFTPGTMNTVADHADDAPEAAANSFEGNGRGWSIPLYPALRMGLDFDITRTGEIVGTVVPRSQGEGTLSAKLVLFPSDGSAEDRGDAETIVLAESDEQTIAMDLSSPVPFKLTLTPTEESDYVAYAKGQNVKLVIDLEGGGNFAITSQQGPALKTADFKMTLPLNEYHDRLTGIADTEEAIEIKANGLVEKAGRPGTTLTYLFTVTNTAPREMMIDLDVAGGDAEVGTLVPSDAITLGSKESRDVTLAVSIPANATGQQVFEVLLFAYARDDPTQVAIARTKTLAVTGEVAAAQAMPDESGVLAAAQAREEKDTPAGGVIVALAAIGVALLASRRR